MRSATAVTLDLYHPRGYFYSAEGQKDTENWILYRKRGRSPTSTLEYLNGKVRVIKLLSEDPTNYPMFHQENPRRGER